MTDPHHAALDAILDQFASRVADLVVQRLRTDDFGDLVDQVKSPLGRRRHIAFVRAGGGVQIGRRYLARREDVLRHMEDLSKGRRSRPTKTMSGADELRARLGLPPRRG